MQKCSFWPIVVIINSPTYKLAKYLFNILKKYTGITSPNLLCKGKLFWLIYPLFTKVDFNNIIQVLLAQNILSRALAKLVEKCFTSTYRKEEINWLCQLIFYSRLASFFLFCQHLPRVISLTCSQSEIISKNNWNWWSKA